MPKERPALLELLLESVRASNEAASLRHAETEREIKRLADLLKSHAESTVAEDDATGF